MPIIQNTGIAAPGIGRGLNAFSLRELVKRRVPGYQDSEYLSEINAAYNEAWEEIMQLDELFFSDIQSITITADASNFDLVNNIYANFSGNSLARIHQISRIRVQLSGSTSMLPAEPLGMNDPMFLSMAQQQPPPVSASGPFYYFPYGENSIRFARPLPSGSTIEVSFTYSTLDLQITSLGLISSSGTTVTGVGTLFTTLAPPEMIGSLPTVANASESQILCEIITGGQIYRVAEITNDSQLITTVPITPSVNSTAYILSSVPELPAYGHRIIAIIATRNVLTTPADDPRFAEWAGLAAAGVQRMKNSFIQRQRQANPKKRRFPYGAVRRGRFITGR